MDLSFVIPAYNEAKLLGKTLGQLQESAAPVREAGLEFEIIVCDNNSTDDTARIARDYGARVVFEPVNQIARARNAGAREAKGRWLAFVDADTLVPRELIRELISVTQRQEVIGGGAMLVMDEGGMMIRFLCGFWNHVGSSLCQWAAGSFLYCRRSAFEDAGGFNHDLYASEEIDLSRRLKRLGKRRGQGFKILKSAPVISSARKLKLYTGRDFIRFFGRLAANPIGAVKNKETCFIWYDGRR